MFRPWLAQTSGFNFEESLRRMGEACKYGFLHLTDVVSREKTNISPFKQPTHCSSPSVVDPISQTYLANCNMEDIGVPYKVSGNGSCLFNSVSLALCGTEELATELRVRTCIEMVIRKDLYMSIPAASRFMWVSPNYVSSALDCAKANGWSSIWTLYALAEVIGIPIESVYPPVNGSSDMSYKILNVVAYPRNYKSDCDRVTVLWTRSAFPDNKKMWVPDHFVPVIKFFNISSLSMPSPPLTPPMPLSPPLDDENFPPLPTMNFNTKVTSSKSLPKSPVPKSTTPPSSSMYKPKVFSTSSIVDDILCEEISVSDHSVSDNTIDPESTTNQNMTPLPPGGLSSYDIYNIITVADIETVPESIPLGRKNNCYTLVNNVTNKERKASNKYNRFCDDMGSWDSTKGTTVKSYFIISSGFKCVYKKKDVYCVPEGKKRSFTPLTPQPEESDIVVMNRYYTTLKRQSDYKKRVTWFSSSTNKDITNIAVVEYIGIAKEMETVHGNAKKETAPYKRTNSETLEKAAKELLIKKPRQVYKEMVIEDEANAPKNMQQLRDLKNYYKKKSSPLATNNVADEVLSVLSMLSENDFVQKVEHTKGQIPSIICYSEQQMIDFVKFVENAENPRVGIDRTFNLGCFYVTSIVYKNPKVVRKDSLDHPIFIGPIFLHKEAGYDKYHYFLSHVQAKLTSQVSDIDLILPTSIQIGSDDEKALTKAIDTVFPQAKRSLCTKHLKDNVSDYLKNKIGASSIERTSVLDTIFGHEGILNAKDLYEFEERCALLMSKESDSNTNFYTYFNKSLKPKLLLNFQNLENDGLNSKNKWTNNNAESIHNIMKIDINWKPQSTPALINMLSDMV